jgi:hypothetical protein
MRDVSTFGSDRVLVALVARRAFDSDSLMYGSHCTGIEDRDKTRQAMFWQADHVGATQCSRQLSLKAVEGAMGLAGYRGFAHGG